MEGAVVQHATGVARREPTLGRARIDAVGRELVQPRRGCPVGPQKHRAAQQHLTVLDGELDASQRSAVVDHAAPGLGHPVGPDRVRRKSGRHRRSAEQDHPPRADGAAAAVLEPVERGGDERDKRGPVCGGPGNGFGVEGRDDPQSGSGRERPGDDRKSADVSHG